MNYCRLAHPAVQAEHVPLHGMTRSFLLTLLCTALSAASVLNAQHASRSGFRSPLDIPLNLSGNFGEFRNNHFHTGLDIKTQGKEGLAVFAVTGGCVSRIRVGAYGYGNALYIDHPNGYTSVYAHLSKFNPAIEDYLKDAQYALESWEVDLYPAAGSLCVDSSEVIARSGNSGSSGGPHLHFEIRETESEFPVNPLLWDFPVADHRAPIIKGILITPLTDSSHVMGTRRDQVFETSGSSGKVALYRADAVNVGGPVGIGIHTIDYLDGNSNTCGIYKIRLFSDDELIYEQIIDRLDFSVNRQLNAHADFRRMRENRAHFHRTFTLPENRLPIYKTIRGNGAITLAPRSIERIRAEVYDVHGNKSEVEFTLKHAPTPTQNEDLLLPEGAVLFAFDRANSLRGDSCAIFVPEGRLYDDAYTWITQVNRSARGIDLYSAHYEVGNRFEPLHDTFLLRLTAREVHQHLQDKLLVVAYDADRRRYSARGGRYHRGVVTARVKEFGEFALALDTVAPSIRLLRADAQRIEFKITDDLSGIESIRATVDGRWIRMHYDPKRNLIWHDSANDGRYTHQGQKLKLEVTDERGNTAVWER